MLKNILGHTYTQMADHEAPMKKAAIYKPRRKRRGKSLPAPSTLILCRYEKTKRLSFKPLCLWYLLTSPAQTPASGSGEGGAAVRRVSQQASNGQARRLRSSQGFYRLLGLEAPVDEESRAFSPAMENWGGGGALCMLSWRCTRGPVEHSPVSFGAVQGFKPEPWRCTIAHEYNSNRCVSRRGCLAAEPLAKDRPPGNWMVMLISEEGSIVVTTWMNCLTAVRTY